jgi:hypothetical protein
MFEHGRWHWYAWNFQFLAEGRETGFVRHIMDALLACDAHLSGFAAAFFDGIADIGGREKDLPQYEQLLQRLAELYVIHRVVTYPWPGGAAFQWEPTAPGGRRNPELTVATEGALVGIEVKAPALADHAARRGTLPTQLPTRGPLLGTPIAPDRASVTLPRDYPVRDFLVSAAQKFGPFRSADPSFVGVLVVVWDDFAYEAVGPLVNPQSGLLTPNSFAQAKGGTALTFPGVDCVVVTRRLHEFVRAAAGINAPKDGRHFLDYERAGLNAFLPTPGGRAVPAAVCDCLLAAPLSPALGAEFVASDVVMWFDTGVRPRGG